MFNETVINLAFLVELEHVLCLQREKNIPQQKRKYNDPQC